MLTTRVVTIAHEATRSVSASTDRLGCRDRGIRKMKLPPILCREDILAASFSTDEVVARSRVIPGLLEDLDLLASLVLTYFPDRVTATAMESYLARLYYFARFVARRADDPSLEDELVRILEQAPPDVDWTHVEAILDATQPDRLN